MFRIVAGNSGDAFQIQTNSELGKGTIGELRTRIRLDREKQDFYELTLSAFDRGQPQLGRYNTDLRITTLTTTARNIVILI